MLTPFVLGLGAALGPSAPPYPIPPRPLRRLVHESEFIVTALVVEADPRRARMVLAGEPEPLRDSLSVVTLVIDGLLEGDPGVRTLEQVNELTACPPPARYVPGTRVLAFLDRAWEGSGFVTHACSFGAKTLADEALAVYLERIHEQLAIERMPEGEAKLTAQVEWLVRCAEHPATRWEGAYELCPTGDFFSHLDDGSLPDFARHLSTSQRTRLRDALLTARSFGTGERCLEELMRDDSDPRLEAWLVARLRADGDTLDELELTSLVDCIARRDDRPEVRERANACKLGNRATRREAARHLVELF